MATTRQTMFSLENASLHPPAHSPDDDDAEIPWVLLDEQAYIADCTNSTTAESTTWDGKRIQVTCCLARPPQVSYICVFCPGLDHTVFPLEPEILAMEDNLVLLKVIVSYNQDIFEDLDYYIYQAADSATGGPSLKRLPRPPKPFEFESTRVGILRSSTRYEQRHEDQRKFFLGRHRDTSDDDFYVVAGLCELPCSKPGQFVLCHYSSKVPTHWSTDKISLNNQQLIQHGGRDFYHINSKVIAIGGSTGTMGFVDLWRGILFCDVLRAEGKPIPPLHYVPLPPRIRPNTASRGDPRLCRDIAVVTGKDGRMIKYVEMQVHWKPDINFKSPYARDGWVARTWKCPVAATYLDCRWVEGCRFESSLIPVDNNSYFKQLPKVLDRERKPMPPFKGFDVRQPTLRVHHDDDTVCFMIKKNRQDAKAWVTAVDMRKNTLLEVAEFAAERTVDVTFAYMYSRISKYLRGAPGTKGTLKRQGKELSSSPFKRRVGTSIQLDDLELVPLPLDAEMESDEDRMPLD